MAEAESASYLKGLRVLAVDDEVDVLDTIEDVLDEALVDRALDYDTALKKLQDTTYDLAILDMASRARVLSVHADRMLALLHEAGLVDDQHTLWDALRVG